MGLARVRLRVGLRAVGAVVTPVLDRLSEIRALVAAAPCRYLYQGLDEMNDETDADVYKAIQIAQHHRPLTVTVTQEERLAVLDLAIAELVRLEIRAASDVEAMTGRKP